MIRGRIPTWTIAVVLGSLCAAASTAANEDKREKAAALLKRAAEVHELRSTGRPAFHYLARFRRVDTPQATEEGTHLLTWASPQRWREETKFPGYHELRVFSENTLWRQRNLDYEPYVTLLVTRALDFQKRLRINEGEYVGKITQRQDNGGDTACVELERPYSRRRFCFDAKSGALISEETSDPLEKWSHRFHGTKAFEERLVPEEIIVFAGKEAILEITIEQIQRVQSAQAGWFTPPPNAEARAWCENPEKGKLARRPEPPAWPLLDRSLRKVAIAAYVEVGADGQVNKVRLVRVDPPAPQVIGPVTAWIKSWRFEPSTCNGVPISWESIIETGRALVY